MMLTLVSCSLRGCSTECDHEWDNGNLINSSECGENAISEFTCLKCGETRKENAKNHNFVPERTIPASCTAMGYDEYKCSLCDAKSVYNFKNAIGHKYGSDVVVSEATCSASGVYEKICVNCGDTHRYSKSATGHSYVLISDEDTYSTYECEHCLNVITINDGETFKEEVKSYELFDVEPTFTFDIVASLDENSIKESLKILDNFYNNSEYEDNEAVVKGFSLTNKGGDVWTVSASSDYEYGTAYIVKLQNGIKFADYDSSELIFTVKNDPNHENVYEYKDGVVFLHSLENSNPGYYPYEVYTSEESEYLYVILNKVDSLQSGMILCVGEVTSFEQMIGRTDCYLGEITEMYSLPSGQWIVVLAEPDITEVFDELDIYVNEEVNFDNAQINEEQIKTDLISALYENEDYIKFLSVINLSTKEYYANNSYYAQELSDVKSFMDKIKLEPDIRINGTKISATVNGSISIPIKNSSKKEIGSFNVGFTVGLESNFTIKTDYEIIEHVVIADEIIRFDLGITQTDTFNFKFKVSIDMYWSSEEHPYVQNTETGKIHRRGCVHLSNVSDTSKYKGLSAETAAQYIDNHLGLACKHCQPVIGFKSDLVVLNTNSKVIHVYGCAQLTNVSDQNKKLSKENSSYWMEKGYTCCQWCHPDSREEFEYEAIFIQKIQGSDWQQVATDMSQWAKDSGIKGKNKRGITITKIDVPLIGPVTATLELNLVLTLNIEASFEYEYSYTQTNVYGIRKQNDDMQPYSKNLSSCELKNHCSVIGKVEARAGLLVDVNINIAGFSKWVRAGVTAEVGAYAQISGVLSWSSSTDENYMAAYFAVGIYLDVNAYYKILWWDDEISLYENKWPLLTMGYERAYFGYETYHEQLVINGSYDIDAEDLLRVKYFDLSTMTTKTGELSLKENKKYTVNIAFADGRYCKVVDGVIVSTTNEVTRFTDTMIITVENDAHWSEFKKGSYVYYLGYYEIDIVFNVEHASSGLEFTLNADGKSYSVTGIGTCTDTEVVIPRTYSGKPVTSIGEWAFSNCSSLTGVVIPSSVTSIGLGAFVGCSSLTEIKVDSNNAKYKDINGNLYTKDGKTLLQYVAGKTAKSFTIPNSVTSIGYAAFAGCSSLTSIVIPNSVTSMDRYAFSDCESLTGIVIPDSVTSIGSSAFRDCLSLTSIVIPDSVTSIGDKMFYNCSSLTSIVIPDSVTSIGEWAFEYCSGLTSVVIPDSVTSIGDQAFMDCDSLTSVVIGDNVTSISWATFYNCSSLTSIVIPESVTSIGVNTFYYCVNLTSIKYRGTEEQWNAISKSYGWNYNTGNYTITYNYKGE